MFIAVCPGQGAQKPGFLTPWVQHPEHLQTLKHLSEVAGVDLVLHGTESGADTIRDTAIAQPLIVAAGILAWNSLREAGLDTHFKGVAGHSVGELTACYVAGVFDAETAMRFVARRSSLMAKDAANASTGMAAVVGGVEAEVLNALEDADCTPANMNCPGQIVAAGTTAALERLTQNAPRGARVIPLQVAGAFHSSVMSEARAALEAERDSFSVKDPTRTLWTNRDGAVITSGEDMLDAMIAQVTQPVRWDRCMTSFSEASAQGLVELPPAGTLVGLAKRGLKGTPTLSLNSPDDLSSVVQFCSIEGGAAS